MNELVVDVVDVSVRRGQVSVLEGISFQLAPRQFLGVVGPNGAGKTTLMRAILGLVPVSAGRIEVLGTRHPDLHSNTVGYVPQQVSIPPRYPASVSDVVGWGGLRAERATTRSEAQEHLERVGIGELAARPVGTLSGGEQRRVLLAQALCASRRLLILDEATNGLDLPADQAFYHLLHELKSELGLAILAVSHDLLALGGEADRLICINRTMHVHGNPAEVVHSHALQEAYSCEFDFLRGEIAHHERLARPRGAGLGQDDPPEDPPDAVA